jgi:hypothetical protein
MERPGCGNFLCGEGGVRTPKIVARLTLIHHPNTCLTRGGTSKVRLWQLRQQSKHALTLTKVRKRFGIVKMEGKAYVGSDLVCEGEFLLAM